MKCRINPLLDCKEILSTGTGAWNYTKNCLRCDIFVSSGQTVFNIKEKGEIEMAESKKIPEWVKARAEEQAKEAQTGSQYFRIPEGESVIEIDETQAPEEIAGNFGTQFLYQVKVEDKKLKLTVGTMLDRMIIKALMQGINPMTVIRAGTGLQTRYSIKGIQ